MDPASIIMTLALIALVALSSFFSAAETAFTSFNRIRMKAKADAGDSRAGLVLRLDDRYSELISAILIGNNIVNIAASTIGTLLFTRFFLEYGPVVSTVVLTVVILIFGEVSPKTLAKENAERFAMFCAPFLRFFMALVRPMTVLFDFLQKGLSKLFRRKDEEGITEEELVTMVDQAESEGGLDSHESELIRSAIEFGDMEVSEILTPRVDIVAVEDTSTMDELAAAFAESGYSRLPIYHEDLDDITGVIHEKDFFAARSHGADSFAHLVSPVLYTTGNTRIADLMRVLQRNKAHMAIVVDEYGGTEGLCTLEDIVEELVGEIWDEHDEVIEDFKKQPDGSYLIACHASLDDLYDLFSLKGESEANTIAGWVMEQIGRVPEPGDSFCSDGLEVTVTRVEHRRVLEIQVVVLPKEEEPEKKSRP